MKWLDEQHVRLLVCGGRDYAESTTVNTLVEYFMRAHGVTYGCHGGARGADQLAADAYAYLNLDCAAFPVENWYVNGRLDRSAGHKRNAQMLTQFSPHYVLAFPGGAGTASMVRMSVNAKVRTMVVRDTTWNEMFVVINGTWHGHDKTRWELPFELSLPL